MAPRLDSRNIMAASLEEREEVESPMARRERHRRFLENRRRKAARSEGLEERDNAEEKLKTPGELDTPTDDTPSEEDEKKSTTTAPPPPPPTAAPVAQTTLTVETKTSKTLLDAPTNPGPRKGLEAPATSPPPPAGPPPPTNTSLPPPTTSSKTSRSLFVNTPITHASFEKSSTTSTISEAPKATASTTSSSSVTLPLLVPSSQSLSSILRSSPSSTFATSTSVTSTTSEKITSSAVIAVPESTSAPPTTTTPDSQNTRAGMGKQAERSSSISSVPTTAVMDNRPTAGLGVADQKGVTATTKDTNTRTVGIVIGVLIGSIALIFLAWLVIGRRAKQLRKRRDAVHEKQEREEREPTFAANRSGSSVAESRIWNAPSTVAPSSVGAPSEAGFPGGFPAALPTYPAYQTTQPSFPSTYSQPSQLPSPLNAHRDVMEFGSPPAGTPLPAEEKKSTSWRDSVATMSTIVSVARFRTVKSWAWDQRKRNMADSNIPALPAMPGNAPYKQLD